MNSAHTPAHTSGLAAADLEQVYDDLAAAIDQAGDQGDKLLAKLALLLAHEVADLARVRACIQAAARDL